MPKLVTVLGVKVVLTLLLGFIIGLVHSQEGLNIRVVLVRLFPNKPWEPLLQVLVDLISGSGITVLLWRGGTNNSLRYSIYNRLNSRAGAGYSMLFLENPFSNVVYDVYYRKGLFGNVSLHEVRPIRDCIGWFPFVLNFPMRQLGLRFLTLAALVTDHTSPSPPKAKQALTKILENITSSGNPFALVGKFPLDVLDGNRFSTRALYRNEDTESVGTALLLNGMETASVFNHQVEQSYFSTIPQLISIDMNNLRQSARGEVEPRLEDHSRSDEAHRKRFRHADSRYLPGPSSSGTASFVRTFGIPTTPGLPLFLPGPSSSGITPFVSISGIRPTPGLPLFMPSPSSSGTASFIGTPGIPTTPGFPPFLPSPSSSGTASFIGTSGIPPASELSPFLPESFRSESFLSRTRNLPRKSERSVEDPRRRQRYPVAYAHPAGGSSQHRLGSTTSVSNQPGMYSRNVSLNGRHSYQSGLSLLADVAHRVDEYPRRMTPPAAHGESRRDLALHRDYGAQH